MYTQLNGSLLRFHVFWLAILLAPSIALGTALDDYVAAPDTAYDYTIEDEESFQSVYTKYTVRVTSLTWRAREEVDHTTWEHWLTVLVPTVPLLGPPDTALLIVSGGNKNSDEPTDIAPYIQQMKAPPNAVLAFFEQVPNQPLEFTDYPGESFTEDEIIAYSYDKFLNGGDDNWPVLLPMVKSSVRAMDTVAEIVQDKHDYTIDDFVVGGASKRGWTTWLTAAVDDRVRACVPIVIDVLNMAVSMEHHLACYGEYSDAIHDYVDFNIFDRIDTPAGDDLRAIVDPYTYRDRYTMPKYIINATGDEFFVLDSSQFYFDDLPGETLFYSKPNSGHGLDVDAESEEIASMLTYVDMIASDDPRPGYTWTFEDDGGIRVETDDRPNQVKLWQAHNPDSRDFRWYGGSGPEWTSTPLEEQSPGSGVYTGNVATPDNGWRAYLIEMIYGSGLKVSSEVRVTPTDLPFADEGEVDTEPPVLFLTGDDPVLKECGAAYTDPGAMAIDGNDGELTDDIVLDRSGLDMHTPGEYTITYTVADAAGNEAQETRTVVVEDTLPPVITLNGSATLHVQPGDHFTDPGASASDQCAGGLTHAIEVQGDTVDTDTPGLYEIVYEVEDNAGHVAQAARTVVVEDTLPPVLSLEGENPLFLECPDDFEEPGYTALDASDGNLTGQVTEGGAVDPATPGQYPLTYQVADTAGNTAQATRTVIVRDTQPPEANCKTRAVTLHLGANGTASLTTDRVDAGSSDSCGSVRLFLSQTVFNHTDIGTSSVTLTVVDEAGLRDACTADVTITSGAEGEGEGEGEGEEPPPGPIGCCENGQAGENFKDILGDLLVLALAGAGALVLTWRKIG
ncbi:MAG: PhoPQ-activated protein PqaA family protein [Candidatus Hydrogenedentota bacterium]